MSSRMNERNAVVGVVNPATHAAGTIDSTAIDLKNFRRAMFVLLAGNLSGGGVIDFKLQSSATSGGSYTDLSGYAITPMNNADGTNSQAIVEVSADVLPDGHRFVRGRVTVTTAASPLAVVALGGDPRFEPVASFDLATVIRLVD
jgi:hypothetical protein